jgi:hypothetical protein
VPAFSASRPPLACFHRGPGVATFRGILPLAALFRRLFFVKGERPRTHSSKKKTMKTNTNKNSDSRLLNRTAQRIEGNLPRIDFSRRNRNRGLPTELLLRLIRREAPEFWELAEVVGRWVWIQFDDRQPRQITTALSEYGFHWNNRRQVWQHPCGTIAASSSQDPRRRYRSYFPADMTPA